MKIHYTVYKVTNKTNGKVYIGTHKTKNLDDGYMGSGKYLKRSIEKHGIENFDKEILFDFDTPEEMYSKEAELVTEDFIAEENTYNLKVGGHGGFDYINTSGLNNSKHTFQSYSKSGQHGIKAITERRRKDTEYDLMWKKSLSNGQKRRYCDKNNKGSFYGKKHTETTKKMIGKSNSIYVGEKNSQFGTMWITDGTLNKKILRGSDMPKGYRPGRVLTTKAR